MVCHLTMPKGWKPHSKEPQSPVNKYNDPTLPGYDPSSPSGTYNDSQFHTTSPIEEPIQKPTYNFRDKCPNCNRDTIEGWIFCNYCGIKLDSQPNSKYTMNKVIEGFDTYDISNVMTIQYPKDWIVMDRKLNPELPLGIHVKFNPPITSHGTYVGIASLTAGVATVLTEYPSVDVVLRVLLTGLAKSKDDRSYSLEESCPSTIGGNPAYRLVEHNNNEKYLKICMIKDNEAWMIIYQATIETYPIYLATVEKMIDSISIGDAR